MNERTCMVCSSVLVKDGVEDHPFFGKFQVYKCPNGCDYSEGEGIDEEEEKDLGKIDQRI